MKNLKELDSFRDYAWEKRLQITAPRNLCGAFVIKLRTGVVARITAENAVRHPEWEHVCVSTNSRCLTWEEMCEVKDLFFYDNEVVMQLHPKKENYVNIHPYCLHLWRPKTQIIPTPPIFLV